MADIEVKQPDQDVSMSNDVTPPAPSETVSPSPADDSAPDKPEASDSDSSSNEPAKPVVGNHKSMPWAWIVAAVLAVAVVGLGWWAAQLQSDKNSLQKQLDAANANPQAIIDRQTNDLIAKVGKLMNLPTGETPTIANVTDASKAKAQSAFFANAQNGDKVLLYVKAGEAILYRPSTTKIILVAPLTFANSSSTGTAPATSTTSSTTKR